MPIPQDDVQASLLQIRSPSQKCRITGSHLQPLKQPPRCRGPSTYRAPPPSRSASSGTPGAAEGGKRVTAAPLPLQPPALCSGRPRPPASGAGEARRPLLPRGPVLAACAAPSPPWREGVDASPTEGQGVFAGVPPPSSSSAPPSASA